MGFMTVTVSQNLKSMQKISKEWSHQLSRYMFFKVIECLEKSNNHINTKSITKIQRIHQIQNKLIEYKIF